MSYVVPFEHRRTAAIRAAESMVKSVAYSTNGLRLDLGLDGQTSMTLHSTPINASQLEIDTFKAGHASMQEGFGGMYQVYEQYLASL